MAALWVSSSLRQATAWRAFLRHLSRRTLGEVDLAFGFVSSFVIRHSFELRHSDFVIVFIRDIRVIRVIRG